MTGENTPPTKACDFEVLGDYAVRLRVEDGEDFVFDAAYLVEKNSHLADHFSKIRLINDGRMIQWPQPDRATQSVSITVARAWKKTFRAEELKTPRRLYGPPPRGEWVGEEE